MTIQYLNTDLELEAGCDLAPLVAALETLGMYPLILDQPSDGLWSSWLEMGSTTQPPEPETTIQLMLDAIESLDANAKSIWAHCTLRAFHLGYLCANQPTEFTNGLSAETIKRLAAAKAALTITLHPPAG